MAKRILTPSLLAVAGLMSIASAAAMPKGTSLRTVSTRGSTVMPATAKGEALAWARSAASGRIPVGSFRLVAQRNGTFFYSIGSFSGNHCFGQGESPSSLGQITWECSRLFPSPALPILTTNSIIRAISVPTGDGESTWDRKFLRLAGVAADGVASIELRSTSGKLIAETPVVRNVFVFTKNPVFTGATELVAVDRAGRTVYKRLVS
jgi:hypothetical protein